jgi:alpha-tubulin suppressor-like RCC1 family protein
MSVNGPLTGLVTYDTLNDIAQDLGLRYVSKDYLLDAYPNLIPGLVTPGLWAWGNNANGEIGNGTDFLYGSPVQIGSLTNWKQVVCGYAHTVGIKTNGTLWAWGDNTFGPLGNNTRTSYSSPIQIGSLTNWKQVAAGNSITLAVKTDGTLWSWGRNDIGQLGNNTRTYYSSPIQIGSLTNWKQVSVASLVQGFWLATKTDGSLWGCGYNLDGELGISNNTNYSSPVQVGSLTDWKEVSCGTYHMIAIKTDGSMWACGYNPNGALGDGTIISKSSPIQVGSLTAWKTVSASGTSYAIKNDGTLWGWGFNTFGSVNPNGSVVTEPTQIGALTNWKQVSAGLGSSDWFLAVKTDGTLWANGKNSNWNLGNDSNVNCSSPIQIGTLTTWKKVSTGLENSAAISDGYF